MHRSFQAMTQLLEIDMAESLLIIENATKEEQYQLLIPQLKSLTEHEPDLIANLSNIAAALKQTFNFFWVGFYIVKNNELVLGPFQGPIACTRIAFGKGVCGASWKEAQTLIVPNVDEFPGHIACNSASKSEIVLPAFRDKQVALVLDVDSNQLNDFDSVDQFYLQQVIKLIEFSLALGSH